MSSKSKLSQESAELLQQTMGAVYERCCQIAFADELAAKLDALPVGAVLDVSVEDLKGLKSQEIQLLMQVYDAILRSANDSSEMG